MIGFNELGKHGRLGNQMFQYAAVKGISSKHNYEWCIPPSNFIDPYKDHQLFEVFTLKSLKNIKYVPNEYPLIVESGFYFDSDLFSNCPDNIDLGGFFQTEKYFKHIEKEIKEDFTFKSNILEPCKNIIKKIGNNCIAIHIRRTDYLKHGDFLGIKYYYEGLSYFKDNVKVIVFSDDKEWCNNQDIFKSNRFFISPFNNYIDLCLMTLCSGHIIANSSFSWWGSWLSNSTQVIAPKKWFGNDSNENKNDTKDIIPRDWIKI